jgi:hypothetical protein
MIKPAWKSASAESDAAIIISNGKVQRASTARPLQAVKGSCSARADDFAYA